MLWLRFAVSFLVGKNSFDEKTHWSRFEDCEGFIGLSLIFLISLAQSFVNFKLAQLVYILPEKYKWTLVAAQACAGIFVALYDIGA